MSLEGMTKVKKALIGNIHLLKKVSGYSAYDLAVADGFKGTLAEWLASLKGEPGYTPKKGIDYDDGAKGDPGTLENHSGVDALNMPVINVAAPVNETDAANKKYVDEAVSFEDISESYISSVLEGVTVNSKAIYRQGHIICGYIMATATLSDEGIGTPLFKISSDYNPLPCMPFCVCIIPKGEFAPSFSSTAFVYTLGSDGSLVIMPCGYNGEASVFVTFTHPFTR